MKLRNKVAIITGGGRGLGREIALAMAGEGAKIAVMSRTSKELEKVQAKINDHGEECIIHEGDVSKKSDVHSLVNKTVDHFSTIDILVNNAAIIGPAKFLNDTDSKGWEMTLGINLNGPFLCIRSVVPVMSEKGGGKIINISSGLGQMPFPRFCAYAVSKAGIIQLTRSLSEELKTLNIQINAIDPGVMDTHMQEELRHLGPLVLGDELHGRFKAYKEESLLIDPGKLAPLAVFLASEDADHLSGYYGSADDYGRLGWQP